MYDAVTVMGAPKHPGASLLPSGHSLDLFVTRHRFPRLPAARADPRSAAHPRAGASPRPALHLSAACERRNRKRFRTGQCRRRSPLRRARPRPFRAPFRRRASSRWTRSWPSGATTGRGAASSSPRASSPICAPSIDPATASFIDGAVLNNRPFQQAISAIHGRPAYRQVDRRLVYIDPHPAPPPSARRPRNSGLLLDHRAARSPTSRAPSR